MGKKEQVLNEHRKGLTVREIQEITQLPIRTIRWAINSSGLKVNKKDKGNLIDNKFYEFILGSVLGDGHISPDGRLHITHSSSQLDYITYKRDFIKKYNLAGKLSYVKVIDDRYINGFVDGYRIRTLVTNKVKDLRFLYYKIKEKNIPSRPYLYKYLSPFAIAIWYMDDGNITNYNLQINTQSFTKHNCNTIMEVLHELYNIETTYNKAGVITIRANSIKKFQILIGDYVIDSLKYKLVPYKRVHIKSDKLLEHPEEDNQQPTTNLND